ncbi:MAG: transcription antitermination factor NusB [Firmicutes bacterium]|nr:transcription antitermination factor NusB [Bacillota bacterium]HPU00271.1 transcription antitermination factor NusB [Bacillota bacterium]
MSRRLARETAFKALFQIDLGKSTTEQALRYVLQGVNLNESEVRFTREMVEGTIGHLVELDRLIQKYLVNWELSRLSAVDRNLLRLALFEILYRPDIPNAVAINESLELAKKYGSSEETAAFINGILDRVASECSSHEK